MKKAGFVGLLAATMLLVAGCGGSDTKEVDVTAIKDSLLNDITYEKTLEAVDADTISFYIDVMEGVEGEMYMTDGSTAEAVAVFTAPDANTARVMKENVQTYLDDQETAFEDYMPEEAKRIQDAVLVLEDNYIILCVSGDSDKAQEIISEAFGK